MHFHAQVRKTGQESNPKHDVYFDGNRKNEMNELRMYFKTTLSDPQKETQRKEIIKKIINYTTQGIDTSRLYPEMVIASATKDMVEKKLVFYYLSIYSHMNADFAWMAINTFTKDTLSGNPNIRALAIRHLSNLRFKGREEYVMPILIRGLDDYSSTGKKACIMGITKVLTQINQSRQQPYRDEELLEKLYTMLRDNDSHVVCCVLEAINQIEPEGIAMSRKLKQYLINNIDMFNQVQLPIVLNYIELYEPSTDEEIFHTLNTLDNKIKSPSLSVVSSLTKLYIKYGELRPGLMSKVMVQVKPSLLAFTNHEHPELEYTALKTITYLIQHHKSKVFNTEYKKFYVRENQPTYLKHAKIQLMEATCESDHFGDIINEFTEYLMNSTTIRETVNAMDRLVLRFSQSQALLVVKTINKLILTTDSNEALCNYTLPLIGNFLRLYPGQFDIFQHVFYQLVRKVSSTTSRCAMLDIIGDYGEHIQDAIELVAWGEDNLEDEVKICLLRNSIKLFFKRPVEMVNLTSNLFRQILTDQQTHLPVRDYAAMLYRGLENDADNLKESFLHHRPQKQEAKVLQEQLQLNTFETVYMRNKSEWIMDKNKYIEGMVEEEVNYAEQQAESEITQEERLKANRQLVDLNLQYQTIEAHQLDAQFEMSADIFERCWEQFEIGASITRIITKIELVNEENLEELFQIWNIHVMASAETEDNIKLYIYLKKYADVACTEVEVNKQVETITLIVKSENEEFAGFVCKYIEGFLKINDLI